LGEAAGAVSAAAAAVERGTPARRAIPVALETARVVVGVLGALVAVPAMQRLSQPQTAEVFAWLGPLTDPRADVRLSDPAIRNAAARDVAGRYRSGLTEGPFRG